MKIETLQKYARYVEARPVAKINASRCGRYACFFFFVLLCSIYAFTSLDLCAFRFYYAIV